MHVEPVDMEQGDTMCYFFGALILVFPDLRSATFSNILIY